MKWLSKKLGWAIFLLLAGVFLLLKNLKVFDRRWGDGIGDGIWGGLFAAAGLGFLIWLLFNFQSGWQSHAWGAIPGFTLLSVGAMLLLEWRAAIPAGVLTVVGVLLGFQERLSELGWLALFFLGLAVVFGLLYLVRAGQPDSRWAAIPAAALALLGVVTLVSAIGPTSEVLKWWPVLLLVGGLGLLLGALGRPSAVKPAVKAKTPAVKPDYSAVTPAPGTSVTADWPDEVVSPAVSPAVTPATAEETPVDLYVKKPI